MKLNKSLHIGRTLNKFKKMFYPDFLSKFKLKNTLESFFFNPDLSQTKRYKVILDKIDKLKLDKISNKKVKKSKKFNSLLSGISQNKEYKKLLKKVNKFKLHKIFIQKFNKNKKNILNLQSDNLRDIFFRNYNLIKKFKIFENKLKLPKNNINKKYDQKIGLIFYGDHNLIIASAIIDLNNNIELSALNELPIPSTIIGDSLVEDSSELANILLDSFTLLDLVNSPLLIVLSSSFFNIHTFFTSDLKQISNSDSKVQSKSPYLPANTLVDFLRMADSKSAKGLVRTIYSKKDFIQSWTDTLEIINTPIIGIVPASAHVFDSITEKIKEEIIVLLDIESTQTTVLIGNKLAELNTYKLPFGYSLYITDDLGKSSKSYFERAYNSVKIIMKDTNQELPKNIFVMGKGLDELLNSEISLPREFKPISDLNLANYLYKPKNMQIHEIVSKSIDNIICSLVSTLSSCV